MPEPFEHLESVEIWHPDVENQERRPALDHDGNRFESVAGLPDLMPRCAEASTIDRPEFRLIIGQDDGRSHASRPPRLTSIVPLAGELRTAPAEGTLA